MILVSVIIPYYNAARTLGRAIDSALAQDVPLEVLVIDDGSPESPDSVLRLYKGDPRVKLIRQEKNSGVAAARNEGVRQARGRYVAFLDADDWWAPDKLRKQLALAKKTGAVLICTGRELMKPDGTSAGRSIPVQKMIRYRILLMGNVINCSSVLLRTDVAREFPMEYDQAHEDYILWLKVLKKYGEARGIPGPYLKYQVSADGKSGPKWKSALMTWRVYRYMGYGPLTSACFFAGYAINGVRKWMM